MNVYPAIRAQMGIWDYFIVKMRMKELASEVHFASEIYTDRTLDDAIQRALNEGRAKKEIVRYLAGTEERFFASIVVAAMDGNPKFQPIEIPDFFSHLSDSMGLLSFDGKQKYYALDGQHRLKAIKTLLDPAESAYATAPNGFANEECSVLVVVKPSHTEVSAFMKSYRRLFSNLNRYAKPVDLDTIIILDEDDAFAILTRRLISDYPLFQWQGRQMESARIKTKGKNLKDGESYFTSLQTLYCMTEKLLETRERTTKGWGSDFEQTTMFKRFRPSDSFLDNLYAELCSVWDLILAELPVLRSDPAKMRVHSEDWWTAASSENTDHLLFWPIGQEVFAKVVRRLLDEAEAHGRPPGTALVGLSEIDWRLHAPPWRNLLLTPSDSGKKWTMRSEDRNLATNLAHIILNWTCEADFADEDELKIQWGETMYPRVDPEEEEVQWKHVQAVRERVQQKRMQTVGLD